MLNSFFILDVKMLNYFLEQKTKFQCELITLFCILAFCAKYVHYIFKLQHQINRKYHVNNINQYKQHLYIIQFDLIHVSLTKRKKSFSIVL